LSAPPFSSGHSRVLTKSSSGGGGFGGFGAGVAAAAVRSAAFALVKPRPLVTSKFFGSSKSKPSRAAAPLNRDGDATAGDATMLPTESEGGSSAGREKEEDVGVGVGDREPARPRVEQPSRRPLGLSRPWSSVASHSTASSGGSVKRKTLDLTQFSARDAAVPLALRPINVITAPSSSTLVDHVGGDSPQAAVAQADDARKRVRVSDLASVFGRTEGRSGPSSQ
jgi:hypothetical protein